MFSFIVYTFQWNIFSWVTNFLVLHMNPVQFIQHKGLNLTISILSTGRPIRRWLRSCAVYWSPLLGGSRRRRWLFIWTASRRCWALLSPKIFAHVTSRTPSRFSPICWRRPLLELQTVFFRLDLLFTHIEFYFLSSDNTYLSPL